MSQLGRIRSKVRVAAIAGFLGVVAAMGLAQKQSTGSGQTGGAHQAGGSLSPAATGNSLPGSALDEITSPFPDSNRQKRNDDRQRRLVSDTQRLLTLTTQLKAEVASTGAEVMSPEMLKQMEEIEKLAKSVKDKMRD